MRRLLRHGLLLCAVLTTLALPGQTLAAAWSEPRAVSATSSADLDQLVAVDARTLVVEFGVFNDSRGPFYLTRSSNGGRSWSAATRVPYSHLSGGSGLLDRVWIERGRVLYARSSDAGKTFGSARTLTPANEYAGDADVARGPDHRVAVVWRVRDGDTYSRLSVDDGATFGGAAVVAANNRLRLSDLAVSNSGIVATYFIGFRLIVKSSDASGRHWDNRAELSPYVDFESSIATDGERILIAYTQLASASDAARFEFVRYVDSNNGGTTWSSHQNLAPASWDTDNSTVAFDGTGFSAAFNRCDPHSDYCDNDRVYYRRSPDGKSWNDPIRVTPKTFTDTSEAILVASDEFVYIGYEGCGSTDCRLFVQSRAN